MRPFASTASTLCAVLVVGIEPEWGNDRNVVGEFFLRPPPLPALGRFDRSMYPGKLGCPTEALNDASTEDWAELEMPIWAWPKMADAALVAIRKTILESLVTNDLLRATSAPITSLPNKGGAYHSTGDR